MADNITVLDGNNVPQTVAFKDVGGVKLSRILAGEHVRVIDGTQSLPLTSAAQTLNVPAGATHALIYAEGAVATDVARYWQGGPTAPTGTTGKRLKDHEEMACASPSTFKAMNQTGSGVVTLRIEYYHYA